MFEIERSLDFDAPVARVWDVFLDLDNWGEWSESSGYWTGKTRLGFALAKDSLRGPGMKIVATNKNGYAHTLIVQEWDKPNIVRFETFENSEATKDFKLSMTWRYTAKSSIVTHLDYRLAFEIGASSPMMRFVQSAAEKKIDEIFVRCRKFL